MNSVFAKFTTHSRNALKNAFDLALAFGHKTITPRHILYGLSLQKGSIAAQILTKAKIESQEIKETLIDQKSIKPTIIQIDLAPNTKRLIEKAFLIASLKKHKYIGTEHLLASILITKDNLLNDFFHQKAIDLMDIQRQIDSILNSTSKFPEITDSFSDPTDRENYDLDQNFQPEQNNFYQPRQQNNLNQPSILELFATNLTDDFIQKSIDPVIGREDEINRLIQILCRRNKNNPLLLGDPGVGKTAIVEGLAKKILEGDVPEVLVNKKIYTLDLSLIVAGTSFRGEFENRLKKILETIKKNPDIIIFIDEIHNIIGTGSAVGSMDAANILKPALARGEIRCIGATTLEGYKKQIESDPALERRFQPIFVNQPTVQKTIEILRGIKNNYEVFHQVKINDQAITTAAKLAERYIPDRFLPDKAIDLIDEAAAALRIKKITNSASKEIKKITDQLKNNQQKKNELVNQEKFSLALKYRKQEKELINQLKQLETLAKKPKKIPEITEKDISQIIAKMTGIPLADLAATEKNSLLKLENSLAKKIIGQEEAIKTIAESIRRARTGITDANRPLGSFIFLGPSGVGKTELAKVLAEVVFSSHQALVKIDMSEFAESFNISKLIGAPAGYVGYKEGTKLTDAVKRRPYSVILFDEIEKAHYQVFNLLLQILEDGYLTDGSGKNINFKNTIIIMTSNLGSESFNQQAALGFQAKTGVGKIDLEKGFAEIKQGVLKKLKEKFPPEFLSRVDKTIVFKPLSLNTINKIAKLQLEELKKRLGKQGIKIELEPKVAKLVAKTSFAPETGARAIRKIIQDLIENQIAKKILTEKTKSQKIKIKVRADKIIIS